MTTQQTTKILELGIYLILEMWSGIIGLSSSYWINKHNK